MATPPDDELAVWPFLPNWSAGVTETLSWGTSVLGSSSGAEQRYSTRLTPRRSFEATFNPIDGARTFFDLFMSTLGGQEMMVPVFFDKHKMSAATAGDNRIDCDTSWGEFTAGGMAVIYRDPFHFETVQIEAVDGTGLDLSDVLEFTWPGAAIYPLRRSRIDLQPSMTNLTSRVAEIRLRFDLNQANAIDFGVEDGLTFDGDLVLTRTPDWVSGIDINFSRIMETTDNGTGLAFIRDIADRAFRTKVHNWQLRGRQENWQFRQFLYRMAGRREPVWIPTGAQDFVLATDAAAGAGALNVGQVGLGYVGGPQPGRDRVLARSAAGYQVRKITGMGAPPDPSTQERINIDSNLTYGLTKGAVLEWMEIMRADGDDIEIEHHTAVDGVSECSINFSSFSDTRDASGPNVVDIPTNSIVNFPCGSPGVNTGPCVPVFNPWTRHVQFYFPFEGGPTNECGGLVVYNAFVPEAFTGPNGKTLNAGANVSPAFLNDTPFDSGDGGGLWQTLRDFPNEDLSVGQPLVCYRIKCRTGPSNFGVIQYEWLFFYTPTTSYVFHWGHQFGAGGTLPGHGLITTHDGEGHLVAQAPYESSSYGHLFPYGYEVGA